MTKEIAAFFKKMLPLTVLLVFVGTFIYGAPIIYLLIRDGFKWSIWGLYLWGLGFMLISWRYGYLTYKAFKQ